MCSTQSLLFRSVLDGSVLLEPAVYWQEDSTEPQLSGRTMHVLSTVTIMSRMVAYVSAA